MFFKRLKRKKKEASKMTQAEEEKWLEEFSLAVRGGDYARARELVCGIQDERIYGFVRYIAAHLFGFGIGGSLVSPANTIAELPAHEDMLLHELDLLEQEYLPNYWAGKYD